ncbi:CinA family protein [Sulfuricaulis sp.]|jgi:nicotinamide-nucleotide amidase|uniref:CinA family protein n=1 Tax=Sulfuricaulis sp. TaxID=2003553 RepID=UPI00355A9C76
MEIDTLLIREVVHALKRQGLMLATAESCTGGWVAQVITSVAGSSEWFERGFVAYTNLAKREMLGVSTTILSRHGAVSEQCARAMAEGALTHSHAQVALAITGIAGPSGGTPEKPVGTVCIAWAAKKRESVTAKHLFTGDRENVRRQSVIAALQGLLEFIR